MGGSGNLLLPVGERRTSSWTAHQHRTPRSTEPGTDFYCPIGTPVLAPDDGVIYGYGNSIAPATGRWVGIQFQSGMSFRALHFSRVVRTSGVVRRGEVIGYSGASGYGVEDWSSNPNTGGAHTHVTLWPTAVRQYGYSPVTGKPYTIDFMNFVGGTAGGGTTPEDDMPTMNEFLNYPAFDGGPTISQMFVEVHSVFNATFNGGPSMEDSGNPIQRSLAQIRAAQTAKINRGGVENTQIQELADVKTIAIRTEAKIDAIKAKVGA